MFKEKNNNILYNVYLYVYCVFVKNAYISLYISK